MATALTPTVVPTGDSALTVVFGDTLDLELNDRVLSLDRWLIDEPIPGVLETVPAFTTLLIRFDTSVLSHGEVISEIERRLRQPGSMAAHEAGRRQWTIPARYGGVHGPDLSEVADLLGKSEESVVSAHAALRLRVLMLGFAPGFAYLGLADDIWDIPRLIEVRPEVPAGSILVAARQTALTATPIPTGWRHVAQTPFRSFDPRRPDAFLLRPGDVVGFEPVGLSEYERLSELEEAGSTVATMRGVS